MRVMGKDWEQTAALLYDRDLFEVSGHSERSRKGQSEGQGESRPVGTVGSHGNVLNLLDAFGLR